MSEQDKLTLAHIPFASGINEGVQSELLDPSAGFLSLENLRSTHDGALAKRYGFTSLTAPVTQSFRIFTLRDSLAAVSPAYGSVYSETASAWTQTDGATPVCDVQRYPVLRSQGIISSSLNMVTTSGGYAVVTWCSLNSSSNYVLNYAVYDTATWACVVKPAALNGTNYAGITHVRMVAYGAVVYALVYHGSANKINLLSLTCTNATTIGNGWTTTLIASDYSAGYMQFDICTTSNSSYPIQIAYQNNSGTTDCISLVGVTTALGIGFTGTVAAGATSVTSLTIGGDGADYVWVVWSRGGNVYARSFGYQLSVLGTTATVMAGVTGYHLSVTCDTLNSATIVANETTSLGIGTVTATVSAGAVSAGTLSRSYNVQYSSKITLYGSYPIALGYPVNTSAVTFATSCLLAAPLTSSSYAAPLANIAPRLCYDTGADSTASLRNLSALSSSKFATVLATRKNQISDAIEIVVFDFGHVQLLQPATIADAAYLSGGVVQEFDGPQMMEVSSVHRPDKPTCADLGAGAATITGWRYIAVFERIDNVGNVHWSAISDPSALFSFSGKIFGCTVSVDTLAIARNYVGSERQSQWNVVLYRTTGESTTGTTYYRLTSKPNVPGTARLTFTDTTTDATLIAGTQLYRQPNVVGAPQNREQPPGLRYLITHGDRLVGVGPDGVSIWYSAKHVIGEGMWFSSLFQFPIEEGGPITGLASQDGRLYVFKREMVFVVDGDGPSENGASGDYSLPAKIPTGVGCIDARSICVFAGGIIFQSLRGIELLNRSLSVNAIGEPIKDTLTSYPVVTSAVVDTAAATVLLTLTNSANSDGRTAVFDYKISKWVSTDKVYQDSNAGCPALAAAMVPVSGVPTYHRLAKWSSGTINLYRQNTSYLDGSTWVTAKAITAWLKPAGIQGEADMSRVLLLGQKATNHDLTMSACYNYNAGTTTQTRTWTAAQVSSVVSAIGREQLELVCDVNGRGQAVRITVSDATPTTPATYPVTTGQGITFIALTLESSPRTGRVKLPSTSR